MEDVKKIFESEAGTKTKIKCDCGYFFVVRVFKKSQLKFLGCGKYPECTNKLFFTKDKTELITESELKMIIDHSKRSRGREIGLYDWMYERRSPCVDNFSTSFINCKDDL